MGHMLLVCPACATRYVVPDAAIGSQGRQVRCAQCRHSWFQDGVAPPAAPPAPTIAAPVNAPVMAPPVNSAPATSDTAPLAQQPHATQQTAQQTGFADFDRVVASSSPAAAVTPPVTPVVENVTVAPPPTMAPPSDPADQRSQFAHEPPFKPRRNPAKLWTMAAVAFASFTVLAGSAIWYFGLFQDSFVMTMKEPDLDIVPTPNLDLQYRGDGERFFIASGTIVNPSNAEQSIPKILVTLKNAQGRSVYSWAMKPPKSKLAAGGKVDFSEARVGVPPSSAQLSFSWLMENN
jgi:predicted Zn finger-like uncharacterized protein